MCNPFQNISNLYEVFVFQYWEKAEFPFEVIPKLGALHVAGATIKVFHEFFSSLLLLHVFFLLN